VIPTWPASHFYAVSFNSWSLAKQPPLKASLRGLNRSESDEARLGLYDRV
jgi:hypothetical protein